MFTLFNPHAGDELQHIPDFELFQCCDDSCLSSQAVSLFTSTVNEQIFAIRRRHNTHVDEVVEFIKTQLSINSALTRAFDVQEEQNSCSL